MRSFRPVRSDTWRASRRVDVVAATLLASTASGGAVVDACESGVAWPALALIAFGMAALAACFAVMLAEDARRGGI